MQYQEDKLTEPIIQRIINVHQTPGPGFCGKCVPEGITKLIEMRKGNLGAQKDRDAIDLSSPHPHDLNIPSVTPVSRNRNPR